MFTVPPSHTANPLNAPLPWATVFPDVLSETWTNRLTARLAATTLVSYTCQQLSTGETFLGVNVFVQVSERTSGKTVAQGNGVFSGFAVCDGTTVNTASVVVIPGGYFTSPPFKKGTALATASGNACSSAVTSGGFQQCDFGSAGPTTISIR